ncbi:cytochrome P450 [Streptomyces tsukubensis]|uniref:Cytochrome n=1 Tax=Streptomyces tsukubensis TaxID=83656 RepID=A0A1V4AEQ6_9ACTN|nr:cytochrome P450 [Streptomyces tsukubensis]OON82596.1 cytochrome [Streptomyces tsukubensis]QFR92239.1 cytochrome P450 [Streptomyces tsukubensis]
MTATLPEFPMPRINPLDPPPDYRALGAEHPVFLVRTPRGDTAWVITRHEDVRRALTHRAFSSDPRTPGFPTYVTGDVPPPPGFFMQADPPDHGRLRRSVSREFLINQMEGLRPVMRRVLDGLIDDMTAQGRNTADLVREFALPMAAMTICEILGVPFEDHVLFVSLTDTVLDRTSTPDQAVRAAGELMGYFDRLVTAKKRQPSEDMFGRMVTRSADGGLNQDELIGMAALLLLAGYDTMAQMIGIGTVALFEHPDQLTELRQDPALLPGAVEEMLRYLSINHAGLPRAVTEDVVVGGQRIHAGEGVLVMLNAANRDESVFENADLFDIHRENSKHVAFGHGFHKCVGATLARVELTEVFGGLLERLPGLRPVKPTGELPFRHDMVLYGVRELPVTW